jgi:ribonuclease D
LHENGRVEWLGEEMAILTEPRSYIPNPKDAWQRLKFRNTKPRFLAILQELAAWREEEARSRDVPRKHILRDDVLVELASLVPRSAQELDHGRGFPRKQADTSLGRAVLDAVARGKARSPSDCPQPLGKPHLLPGLRPVVELLKVLLKTNSEAHGVAQKLIASTADLEMIASDDDADVPALHGWRWDLFGADALALKHGELALTVEKNQVALVKKV